MDSSNENNGLITKVWGSSGWTFNHSITFGYPVNPTEEQKKMYRDYFISLGNVLPCVYCRNSYMSFINEGESKLTDDDLKDRESLTKWFYRVHNAVNNKLGIDYCVSYEDVSKRYESFRAQCSKDKHVNGCVSPLNYKAFSFKTLNLLDCPVIPLSLSIFFEEIARKRGVSDDFFGFIEIAKILGGDIKLLKKQKSWEHRNRVCQMQIKFMRENAIKSIETDGDYAGMPSVDELKLILFMCSNLNKNELEICKDKCIKIDEIVN